MRPVTGNSYVPMTSYRETSYIFTNLRKSIKQSILDSRRIEAKRLDMVILIKNGSKNIADDGHSDDTRAETSGLFIINFISLDVFRATS